MSGQPGPVQQPAPAPAQPLSQAPRRTAAPKAGGPMPPTPQHAHQAQLLRSPAPNGPGRPSRDNKHLYSSSEDGRQLWLGQ
jgi:hypothetical protein